MSERKNWDEYFIDIAKLVATRSTCIRRAVGAVIVKDKNILATGYNGAPSGITHCEENNGCLREKLQVPSGEKHEICRGVHAEQNAIIQAAKHGTAIKDSTIYVTNQPCIICSKMIINAGIKKIVYLDKYPDKLALDLLKSANIEILNLQEK